ncbi:hypothetical protein DN752_06115 [Echinicola strongylocentroti]|uniref:Uncharacterized protein n=1 Tax=Echinicola strongylocentroti TaxID=1795355 RepID=A0A2Z4IG95_9BACT|nr:hypothetical protein DN752_06115 [Echinicola strongylocentroti]
MKMVKATRQNKKKTILEHLFIGANVDTFIRFWYKNQNSYTGKLISSLVPKVKIMTPWPFL